MTSEDDSHATELTEYKILLSGQSILAISRAPDERKREIRSALRDLASGRWERWNQDVAAFVSWREDGNHDILFTLSIPDFGVLLWHRAWSVDLLGRVAYPSGAYYEQPPPATSYSPHIVIRAILPTNLVRSFQLQFDGKLYKEEPGLEHDDSWRKAGPADNIAYEEELYLLSMNVLDDLLDGRQEGLPLHLSEEQMTAVGVPGPVLLSGEAGSGKTSVVTQWLVINHLRQQELGSRQNEPIHQLFVTLGERLRDRTNHEFEVMLPKTARNHRTDFRTYRELLWEILDLAGEKTTYPQSAEMTFERFLKEYAVKLSTQQIDPILLWDEIRSVIKGGASGESDVLLDYARYEELSDDRGQCKTPPSLRELYYEAAQAYQNYLFRNRLWDGIDLARACLRVANTSEKYEAIACDEVQDLAPVEIVLLFRLLQNRDISNLFFTGDVAQVINPSGFLWARLKQELYQESETHQKPDVKYLRRNYRSCHEIVDLVNSILNVRRDLLDDEVSHIEQVPLLPANVLPMVLRDSPLQGLESVVSNPNLRLVLTKTSSEKARVMRLLGDALDKVTVLTIEEAKGLEYEGVLLWNFFLPRHEAITRNDWEGVFTPGKRERLKDGISLGKINPYGLTYEFNLLHVGLTRARRLLFVFDEDPVMRIANLGDKVSKALAIAEPGDFSLHWKTESPTPEDLYELGVRLSDRDPTQAVRMFLLSAASAEKAGKLEQAARSYESGKAYDRSAHCYKAIHDRPNELRVLSLHHQSIQDWREAGKLSEERGRILLEARKFVDASEAFEAARPLYTLAGDLSAAARCAYSSADSIPSERSKDRAVKFEDAAEAMKRAGDLGEAVDASERAIREAHIAKQAGKSIVPGIPNEDWIARLFMGIASIQESRKNHADAGLAAKQAAGLWMNLAEDATQSQHQRQYEFRCCEALANSVESYIRSGETIQAATVQSQLLKRFKGGVEEAKEHWGQFGSLYLGKGELDQYAETYLQLSRYLSGRKEYREALDQVDHAFKECQSRNASRLVLKLLQERVEITRAAKDPRGIGDSYDLLAQVYATTGDSLKQFENLRLASQQYWLARDEDKANLLFEQGYDAAKKSMAAIEVGMYCYKNVVVDALAIRGMFAQSIPWIDRSAIHFAQDPEASIRRLQSNWQEQDNEAKRLMKQISAAESEIRKQEIETSLRGELRLRAMTEITIAKVYQSSTQSFRRDVRQLAREWASKARESGEASHDRDAIRDLTKGL